MHQIVCKIKFFILLLFLLNISQSASAQLSAADSTWFNQIFDQPRYADDSAFPGNWFVQDTINSTAELYNYLDSSYVFDLADFSVIDSMVVNDTLFYDSLRNDTYNSYPFVFQNPNPLTYIDYSLNGKNGRAYNFVFPKDTVSKADYAFLIVQGNGNNGATEIVQGYGYYNLLCYVSNGLKSKGDVFAFMKPNEDARAVYWNKHKLNHMFLVSYLDSAKRQFGLNYLTEIIATIKLLKQKYCKVIVLGLSEGGYASLLASAYTHPDAAVISGGYSIGFDTSWASYSLLQQKFDSLVFSFDKNTIKNNILANDTKYLFTWGDLDPVNCMQAEHDSNYTKIFYNDSVKTSFYFNYVGHTFPDCMVLDSFIYKKGSHPILNFNIVDTSNADTMITMVSNCSIADYNFDLFKNDTLYQSFSLVNGDTLIQLVDSGLYYIKNIANIYGDTTLCFDTIYFNKPSPVIITPDLVPDYTKELILQYANPVRDVLHIKATKEKNKVYNYSLFDILGEEKVRVQSREEKLHMDLRLLPPGLYLLKVSDGNETFTGKIIKQ